MARFSPYTLQMQITRMFIEGQSFFATTKVQDWLRERGEEPQRYEILFHKKPAPPVLKRYMRSTLNCGDGMGSRWTPGF